jgi:solute:Na+ symporter, SSS family
MGLIYWASLYSVVLIIIGLYAYFKTDKLASDYFVAGRSLGTFITLMTVFHTMSSAMAIMGFAGAGYMQGIGFAGIIVGVFWAGVLFVLVGSRISLLGRKYDWITPGDFLGDRYYSKTYRLIISIILIYFTSPYIGLQIGGMARALQADPSVSFLGSYLFLTIILIAYVMLGGMKGVAWTDAVQGLVHASVVIIATILIFRNMPGTLTEIINFANEIKPGLTGYGAYPPLAHLSGFMMCFALIGWPQIFARLLSAKNTVVFRKLSIYMPMYQLLIAVPIMFMAIFAAPVLFGANLTPVEADLIFPMAVEKILPPFFGVLMFFVIYSASMSTADSQALVSGSMFTRDIYEKFIRKNASQSEVVIVGRLAVALLIVISAYIGYAYPGSLFVLGTRFAIPGYMQVIPPIIAGLYWKRATKEGAIAATILGTLTILITTFVWINAFGIPNLLWGLVVNIIVLIVVSLATPKPSKEIIEKYFDSVNDA